MIVKHHQLIIILGNRTVKELMIKLTLRKMSNRPLIGKGMIEN
jgi:hypothetical protein